MTDQKGKRRVTRRGFIKQGTTIGAGVAVAPLVLKLSACSSDDGDEGTELVDDMPTGDDPMTGGAGTGGAGTGGDGNPAMEMGPTGTPGDPEMEMGPTDNPGDPEMEMGNPDADAIADGAVLVGLYPGDGAAAMAAAAAKLDFSWLNDGDSVLIKVASNSGHAHPANTSAPGVAGMVAALKARGAGRVIVGDQAGVEWVRKTATGRLSSTRQMFEENGLAALEGDAELTFFDDEDWETGYIDATLPEGHSWPRGLKIARVINEVDHIVYMPRISAHTLAGLTNAQKSAIGWLRDDSRHDIHNDSARFYEKYAEINYCEEIASRLRLTVSVSEKVQLFGGPDEGTAFTMDPPLVIASTRIANHDAMAASVLVTLHNTSGAAPSGMIYNPLTASLFNGFFASGTGVGGILGEAGPWTSGAPRTGYTAHDFETAVSNERAVARGWELSGGRPSSIEVVMDGDTMNDSLQSGIESHGGGLYSIS